MPLSGRAHADERAQSSAECETPVVFSRGKQRGPDPVTPATPDDATIARQMAGLAEAFVSGSAEEGEHFDFAPENAPRLDAWVDLFVADRPTDDVVHSVVVSMGAYVGELIVRSGGGEWTFEPQADAPGVRLISGLVCFPLNKVGKRITVGPEHSIAQFVQVALSGELPPEARRVDPQPPANR
jgi:hypothetical protein